MDEFDARRLVPVCPSCGGTTGCAHCCGTGSYGYGLEAEEDDDVLAYVQWLNEKPSKDSSSIGPEA